MPKHDKQIQTTTKKSEAAVFSNVCASIFDRAKSTAFNTIKCHLEVQLQRHMKTGSFTILAQLINEVSVFGGQ